VTNEEFISTLDKFRYYLKPALFLVLRENAEAFSEETKKEIIEKLAEADRQMQELSDYQEVRNNIMRKGLEKIQDIYSRAKAKFQQIAKSEQEAESQAAEEIITNL